MPAGADLGGIEQAVLHLSAALRTRGHAVECATAVRARADIVVAVNDARLLGEGGGKPVVWFHNEVGLWRELRRGRVGALHRLRPDLVFCGRRQAMRSSRMLPAGRRIVLPHGLPEAILSAQPAMCPPPPVALFVSQGYRGLPEMLDLWRSRIVGAYPAARLHAYLGQEDVGRFRTLAGGASSIVLHPRVANAEMPLVLRGARLLLAPGHVAETFCLAAAEAVSMGVPVVTYGRGALAERVSHGSTGFICTGARDMAASILALLDDDALWLRMHEAGRADRSVAGWDHVAALWERAFIQEG